MNIPKQLHGSGADPGVSRVVALARRALVTTKDPSATIARLVLGGVLLPHGAQHLFGSFGGYGYTGERDWMVATLGVPGAVAGFAIVMEVVAPLLLLVGLGGRYAAVWLAGFMVVAASTHASVGFFMNWFGKQSGEGFEYHLLAIALSAVVAVRGSGAWSIDRLFSASRR